MVKLVGVIPARMGATRCPGKPLFMMAGKPMVQWVYEAAKLCPLFDRVVIATPDVEIVDAAERFGGEGILTSASHPTGTDRIAEVAEKIAADAYVNIQGDEPLIKSSTIEVCAALMMGGSRIASVYDWAEAGDESDPSVVKVVTDENDRALYFSRSPIPYIRGEAMRLKKHIGLYGYCREELQLFARWEPTPLEKAESLEQLRFLEHGLQINMARAAATKLSVDTPEQAQIAAELLAQGAQL